MQLLLLLISQNEYNYFYLVIDRCYYSERHKSLELKGRDFSSISKISELVAVDQRRGGRTKDNI